MATLNTSANGPSIKSSYQKVVDASLTQGASPTHAHWTVFSVQTPLTSAFQQDAASKESVLKVQATGDGELSDLLDDFSEGRVQFAFAKIRDPNTALPKCVLIAWCGEGVPERTKGYFGNYLSTVSKILHGYHVQITARSDGDLTPDSIIQKVADSSGSRYGGGPSTTAATPGMAPPSLPNKPVSLPTRSTAPVRAAKPVDADGWGADAPQVSRTQLEKVESAYKPTKVNMAELTSQKQSSSSASTAMSPAAANPDVVKGGYQPIGKVDIAAIRRQAQQDGPAKDDRPTVVRGSYEPVGKVDIAAIRARAQPSTQTEQEPVVSAPAQSLADRSTAFQADSSERLSSMPKPKVANRFGAQASTFAGTKTPSTAFGSASAVAPAPVGVASRTFADEGGKTPAQIWAEKKGRQGRNSISDAPTSPVQSQPSGGWQSGYTGKKWDSVQTTRTGTSNVSADATSRSEEAEAPVANVSSIKDLFSHEQAPPPPNMSSKPNSGRSVLPPSVPAAEHVDLPTPPRAARTPSPEPSTSPARIAMPVSRTAAPHEIESHAPPTIPITAIANALEDHKDTEDVEGQEQQARATTQAAAPSLPPGGQGGKRALVQFDYEKAEDNEIELKEGEYVTEIDMVDDDWWLGQNAAGERGLFPSNYVELVGDESAKTAAPAAPAPVAASAPASQTATAQYDYEAAEDNELSFPDGAKITNVEFPDDDWWLGEYGGRKGLFPANYVALDQ